MRIEDYQNMLRHDLGSFIRFAFHELNPNVLYQHNWHVDVMAYYLNEVVQGRVKRLIINVPPRMLKSHCASIALPVYMLGRDPTKKLLYLHASKVLGRELEDKCLQLMNSKRYRAIFPYTTIKEDKNRLITSFGGHRQCMPITGRLTGLGADIIIIDDPISTQDARDESARKRLHNQFDENITQRLNNKKGGAIVLVMQRVHEADLAAHLLTKNEGWVLLSLPAIAMQDEIWNLPYGGLYTRKKGEPLHPVRESQKQLLEILHSVGGYAFAYQYLQGTYKPQFGDTGHGCLWITPFREGVFWDARKNPNSLRGFYQFDETHLILPRVFGIGEDLYPPDMRNRLTEEEWEISVAEASAYQKRLIQEYEEQQR